MDRICFNCQYWSERKLDLDSGSVKPFNKSGICERIGSVHDRRIAEVNIDDADSDKKAIIGIVSGNDYLSANLITSSNFSCILFQMGTQVILRNCGM